jgi:phosphatidylglycerol---prolipoprotein diacylglyceryl transferase
MLGTHFWLLGLEFDTFYFFTYLAFLSAGAFFYWYSEKIGFGFWGFILVFAVVVILAPVGGAALSALEFHHSLGRLWQQNLGSTHLGGYLLALPVVMITIKLLKDSVARVMDGVTFAWILGYGVGRFACFFSGDGCYGPPTSSIFGMTFPHGIAPTLVPVWPTPLFESGYSIAIFIAFFLLYIRKHDSVQSGWIFFSASFLMFLCRFGVEFIRRNPKYDGLSLSQWICIPLILCYAILSIRLVRRNLKKFSGPSMVSLS